MYKDSSMKRKEKKRRRASDVKFQSSILMSRVNHMIGLSIIFFQCDLHNVRVESLTLLFSFSDCSNHSQFDIVNKFDIMCDLISFTV